MRLEGEGLAGDKPRGVSQAPTLADQEVPGDDERRRGCCLPPPFLLESQQLLRNASPDPLQALSASPSPPEPTPIALPPTLRASSPLLNPLPRRLLKLLLPSTRREERDQDRAPLLGSNHPRYVLSPPPNRAHRSPPPGLSATTYGLYQFYTTFTTFPNTTSHPIRSHLRAALRSASTSSYPRASTSFEKAYALALELASRGDFGTPEEALMKTTGIAVKWGGMWEDAGERGKARECYELGWREVVRLLEGQENEGEKEVMRGVAIAIKIGDLWVEEGSKGDREAEKYYVWCVEEMMKLGMSEAQKNKVDEEVIHGIVAEKDAEDKGMELPKWLGNVELVAGFERLGELYARAGNTE